MVYSDEIEDQIDRIIPALEEKHPGVANPRWHALKLLEGDKEVTGQYPLDLPGLGEKDYESQIINEITPSLTRSWRRCFCTGSARTG